MSRWVNFSLIALMWIGVLWLGFRYGGFAAWFLGGSGAVLIGYLLYVQCLPMRNIEASASADQLHYYEGDAAAVTVRLRTPLLPLAWIGVEDGLHQMPIFPGLKRSFEYCYLTDRLVRGKLESDSIHIYLMDVFGWVIRKKTVPANFEAYVYPRLSDEKACEQLRQVLRDRSVRAAYSAQETEVPETVRDYQHGDPFNRIHWKASARTLSLKTMVPEKQQSGFAILVLDAFAAAETSDEKWEEQDEKFEACVRMAAELLEQAWKQGRYPGLLLCQGKEICYIPPGSKENGRQMLRQLSLCQRNGALRWEQLLAAVPSDIYERCRLIGIFAKLPAISSEHSFALDAAAGTEQTERFHAHHVQSEAHFYAAPGKLHSLVVPGESGQKLSPAQQARKTQWEQLGRSVFVIGSVSGEKEGEFIA